MKIPKNEFDSKHPIGRYIARVTQCTAKFESPDKGYIVSVEFTTETGVVRQNWSTAKLGWKIEQFQKACELPEGDFDTEDAMNKMVGIEVSHNDKFINLNLFPARELQPNSAPAAPAASSAASTPIQNDTPF